MLFFGRAEETQRLASLIFSEKLTVLYGKSGCGKSSLLQAGVLPRLREENQRGRRQYVPISIRFQNNAEAEGEGLFEKFRFHWQSTIEKTDIPLAPSGLPSLPSTIWGLFKSIASPENTIFVLLFDQFEEFFTYPPAEQAKFKSQLSEILYSAYPEFVRTHRHTLSAEILEFLGSQIDVRAVFAIREDRFSELDKLSDKFPDILRKRMQLHALNLEQAREAIVRPAQFGQTEEDRARLAETNLNFFTPVLVRRGNN